MTQQELELYFGIYLTPGIGAKRLLTLCEYFGGAEKAFAASAAQIRTIDGFGKTLAKDFTEHRINALEKARKLLSQLPEHIGISTFFDEEYPDHLRKIFQPPA